MSSNTNSNNFRGRGRFFWRGRGNFRGRGFYNKHKKNDSSSSEKVDNNLNENVQPFKRNSQPSSKVKPTQIPIDSFYDHTSSEYKAWKLYHPMEEYNSTSSTVKKIKTMEQFIKINKHLFNFSEIEDRKSFYIDLNYLTNDDRFLNEWQDFQQDLNSNPDHTLNCLSLAMHQFILTGLEHQVSAAEGKAAEGKAADVSLPIIRIRILNYEPVVQLKDLAANTYGKLVSIKGTVIRVGNIKLFCSWLAFFCNKCNNIQCVLQQDGCYTLPTSCTTQSCASRTFTPLCSSPYSQTVNWQTVKIQEIITDDQCDGGRVPKTVECELFEDLVDTCLPGDVITVTGIVKIRCTNDGYGKKNKSPSMFSIYIEGKSIINNKNYSAASGSKGKTIDIEFSTEDYYNIRDIHSRPELFKLAVNSLCPAIYGHEMVKAGLLLGLVGGMQDGVSRGDSHILVVGDPGLGKSQMLQACATVAPRGVYVCGNTSTTTGLTVTLTREAGGNFALEAGALVLADQGCCCIDEFDKMSNQHQALLEAMEQQVISISKAGVICTLPARTSILAAANPVCGHYNRAKTIAENLRLGSALLSRFDLVFILQDHPNEHMDTLLSEHVMALYSGLKQTYNSNSEAEGICNNITSPNFDASLSEKLKLDPGENIDLISASSLRKYIAYAKKYVPNPRLSDGAVQVVQQFYLELRRKHHTLDATPITTRQLESLIRLTQARAKLELREEATVFDALDVIELMRWSMDDAFSDGIGGFDFQRSQNGSGMSTKSKAKQFINALHRLADVQGRSIFSVEDMKGVASKSNIQIGDFFSFLSSLNDQGFLLKKGKNLYQLLSVDY